MLVDEGHSIKLNKNQLQLVHDADYSSVELYEEKETWNVEIDTYCKEIGVS